jgi:hypothetical protein
MRTFCTTLIAVSLLVPTLPRAVQEQTTEKPDLSKQPTLYVVGYAHLDTEWRFSSKWPKGFFDMAAVETRSRSFCACVVR